MIQLNNINFSYGKTKLFEDLSFTFDEGKIYGLLGLNGAGKSTLLYLMSGLLFAQKGTVTYKGKNVASRRPSTLADMFLLPEEFELPNMKFEKFISINAPFYPRFSRQTLERCLSGFEMSVDINLGNLSMGQKKKAFMCFALAANTSLLLLDEPTNGLDIPSKSQFRKVVSECMTDDRTIIISTHQVRDVENLIDEITIVNNRSIVFDEPVSRISAKLLFADRAADLDAESIIFTQPSPIGNMAVARRTDADDETQLNIELLFNAVLAEPQKVAQIFKSND
ncbi:MAG: ATP-binding cassette domain-containing protein [Bacteroidales bacterium]|nr:ATP-binding cassette domain-containing protein [Bacteroidales bacterium]